MVLGNFLNQFTNISQIGRGRLSSFFARNQFREVLYPVTISRKKLNEKIEQNRRWKKTSDIPEIAVVISNGRIRLAFELFNDLRSKSRVRDATNATRI